MKNYVIKITQVSYIEVEAENDEEAIDRAYGRSFDVPPDESNAEITDIDGSPVPGEWFGIVRWHEDDIRAALLEDGYEPTEDAIGLIRTKMENHGFTDLQISDGWDKIHQYIADEADNLTEREVI